MPNYGLNQLVNSREIPRYAGAPVAELASVAQHLQGKYDMAVQNEDALDSALKQASSLGADNKMLQEIKDRYRGKLKERAAKGDYEHMLRDVQRDARDFVNEYKPIAANQAAVSQYYNELQEQVTKGDVSKNWADRLYDASTRGYQGLRKNPQTGQYENQFRGTTAVKNINMEEWVDKALKGLDPKKIGTDVQWIKDGFYRKHGETSEKLTMKEIWPALEAAMGSDPMFQSYAQQKMMLDSYSAKYITEEGSKKTPFYAAVRKLADETGMSFNEAAEQHFANNSWTSLVKNIQDIGAKYVKNNRTTEDAVLRETESTSRAAQKALDDQDVPLYAQIMLPGSKPQFADPVKLEDAIKNSTVEYGTVVEKNFAWMRNAGVRAVGSGANMKYIDKDGFDVTKQVITNKSIEEHAKSVAGDLVRRQKEAMAQAGYNPNAADISRAQKAYAMRLKDLDGSQRGRDMGRSERLADAQRAYDAELHTTAGYKQYKDILAQDAKGTSVPAGVQNFRSKAANTAATNLFKGLALNLDKDGIKAGALGLTKVDGTPLSDDDYTKVKGDVEFVGKVWDPADSQLKFIYKVGHIGQSKGEMTGEQVLVKMPAMGGAIELSTREGDHTAGRQIMMQSIAGLGEDQRTDIPIGGGNINVRKYTQRERQMYTRGAYSPEFEVTIDAPGEASKRIPMENLGTVITSVGATIDKYLKEK
jgi:hypothetical protein